MKLPPISLLLTLLCSLTASSAIGQGYLHTESTRIVDANGDEVIFRGIGFGGWMLQEGYMLGTSGPQHELETRIEALVGPEKKAAFYEAWLANHTRKIDIDSMGAWGYNLVRLPMHYKLFTPPIEEEPVAGEITWRDKGFEMVDQLLDWCEANNIYLILDLHAAPGGQGENADISDYDRSKPSLWESPENQAKTVALWRKLAERYADEPFIGGYDIINEPNWGFQDHENDPNGCSESGNAPLWKLQKEITAAIREVDTNHIIIIEGNCWGNNYSNLPALWDDNIVISFHKYWNPNDQGSIQHMLDMRADRNVPIWLGETGENSNTWFTEAIDLFERNGFGWSWWPLKKLGYNNPLQVKRNPGYEKILDYWKGNGPKPSTEEAYKALMQLAEDLKLENNLYHPDVVDAMIRQPHSDAAVPYKKHVIAADTTTIIYATDYDMGHHDVAYHDKEFQNITTKPGGQAWNLGSSYRNDGVDIQPCKDTVTNGYNVGWTEDGEWMQYTVQVEKSGNYDLTIRSAANSAGSKVSLSANGTAITKEIALPYTGGHQNWQSTLVKNVPLRSGMNIIRLNIIKGGANINYLSFTGPVDISGQQPSLLKSIGYHDEERIELIFDQLFEPIPSGSVFKVAMEGEEIPVTSASLAEESGRMILIETAGPLQFGQEVLISYSASGITAANGVTLHPFQNQKIEIVMPDGAVPLNIPGRVQVEDFTSNRGFEFELTTDAGGGKNAGYTDAGDYLDFLVYVEKAGIYDVHFRVASESAGGSLMLLLKEDHNLTELASVNFGATGGWQNWTTVTASEILLSNGLQRLRLLATGSLFNINWLHFDFLRGTLPSSVETPQHPAFSIFPNPGSDSLQIAFSDPAAVPDRIDVYDMSGIRKRSIANAGGIPKLHIRHHLPQGQYVLVFEKNGKRFSRTFLVL